MLIQNAEVNGEQIADVKLEGNRVVAISASINPVSGEQYIDARGGMLLPGLHDHHIHLTSLAVSRQSVFCGPPAVNDERELERAISAAALNVEQGEWVRCISYHDSVAGELTRQRLDKICPNHPLRIQHRSGRLWMFNSAGLEVLKSIGVTAPESQDDLYVSGRLFDQDSWLRSVLAASQPPSLVDVGHLLNRYGVTGVTDTTPYNAKSDWNRFATAQDNNNLSLRLRVMGTLALSASGENERLQLGEFKMHLSDAALPALEEFVDSIAQAHEGGRNIAVHCVTQAELVLTLAAIEQAGVRVGDRIEHGSVIDPELLVRIKQLGLAVITQPNFIADRGDAYLEDIEATVHQNLYRAASLEVAGIGMAFGTDAPFGNPNPWLAMQAATDRKTAKGEIISASEAVTAERALAGFLTPLHDPAGQPRSVEVGALADLCLLRQPWQQVKKNLASAQIAHTWFDGKLVYSR